MKSRVLISILFGIILSTSTWGQRIFGDNGPCDQQRPYFLIGDTVKIWDAGGIYEELNKTKTLKWPTREIKKKAGKKGWKSYEPKAGDIGEIVHVFEYNDDRVNSAKYIYLLQIENNYVPIGCGYITEVDKMTGDEEWEYYYMQDSIQNSLYADSCLFKLSYGVGGRYQGGVFKIDSLAETFACEILDSKSDTILMMKSFNNNHGLGKSNMILITWREPNNDYIKFYKHDIRGQITEQDPKLIPTDIIDYFFEKELETNDSSPKSIISVSHPNVYNIYFVYGNKVYQEYLTYREVKDDPEHLKTIWWKKLLSEINSP